MVPAFFGVFMFSARIEIVISHSPTHRERWTFCMLDPWKLLLDGHIEEERVSPRHHIWRQKENTLQWSRLSHHSRDRNAPRPTIPAEVVTQVRARFLADVESGLVVEAQ